MMKKLILIDDHKMLRNGIKAYIKDNSDWQIIGEAESLNELSALLQNITVNKDDIVIAVVDIQLKGEEDNAFVSNGFEAVRQLSKKGIASVIFSSHDTGSCIERAISPEVGAKGFVSKCSDEKLLLEAINTVAQGRTFIQPDLITGFLETRSLLDILTKREHQVVNLIESGLTNEEIAEQMGIKNTTLENYISIIYDKLGCQNRKALIEKLR